MGLKVEIMKFWNTLLDNALCWATGACGQLVLAAADYYDSYYDNCIVI